MQPPSLIDMRHRSPTLIQRTQPAFVDHINKVNPDRSSHTELGDALTYRKFQSMYDVVTPGFRKRSARGEIINSPLHVVKEVLNCPLLELSYQDDYNEYSAAKKVPMIPKRLNEQESIFTSNYNNAITDAYADISANDGETLLWLGELRETVSMVFDIGNGLRALYEKTKKQRKEWAKGKLTVEAQQQLTLQILYGILPLEQQISDFMDGLFKIKQAKSRQTARGFRVKSKSASYRIDGEVSDDIFIGSYTALCEETLDVTVRAGVLYEIDVDDLPWISIILDPKAVVSTAYALSRLSFVIDWFINVGGTLAAWSPSFGVKELSAWVTVETTHTQVVKFIPSGAPVRAAAEGGYDHTVSTKWRKPINRSDLAIFPRLDVNLDLDKIFALVLLFAKVKKEF